MGNINDFVIENGILKQYIGNGGSVVIPEGVTQIESGVFKFRSKLQSVVFPVGLISIEHSCFENCHNLQHVVFSEGLKSIGKAAFQNCISLTSATFPKGLATIESQAFEHCCNLNSIVFSEGLKSIGEYAFRECSSLMSVTFPKGMATIGYCAFEHCSHLKNVAFSEGLTSIEFDAFNECSNLTSVTIPDSIQYIGGGAFSECPALTEKDGIALLSNCLIRANQSVSNVTVPAGTKLIASSAFGGCNLLKSISIPDSVTCIGDYAFSECSSLANVLIPNSVTTIGHNAFEECNSLTSITLPHSVTSIAEQVFLNCSSLTNVIIPDSVTSIGHNAFEGCGSLTTVTLPNSVTSIAEQVFLNCSSLTNVIIPDGVTSIGHNAFEGCSNLMSVTIPDSVRSIEDDIFKNCSHLTEVNIPIGILINMKDLPGELMRYNDLSSATNEQVAYLYLNKRSNSWKQWLREKYVTKDPKGVFNCFYTTIEAANKVNKTEALLVSEFIERYSNVLSNDDMRMMLELLEQKKCPVLAQLRKMPWIECHLVDGKQPMQEHPIEAYVKARFGKLNPDPRIVEAVKKGIHFSGSSIVCSRDVLVFIISRYAKKMNFDKNGMPLLKYDKVISFDQEADHVAAALDRRELSDLLTRLVKGSYGLFLLAWARYTEGKRIDELMAWHISMKKGKAKLDSRGSNFYEALLLNDTVEAVRMYDQYGDLERYARRRNVTAAELRDSILLPDFGFDVDGIKRYDIGGNTIEVSIASDLSFRLFDVDKQKEIRSFPKKSGDLAKAETCAKEFATFKKDVLAFAKKRTELLHKMHMSGDYVRADLWQKVYMEHPVISKLGQLVVWQDETGKTFMIKDGGIIDSLNNTYVPQEKVRMAHVLDMVPADIAAWQQWLVRHGCVQLFEQIWEPVISWNENELSNRYNGAALIMDKRDEVKKALKVRGVDMRADEWEVKFEHDWDHNRTYFAGYGSKNDMLFGDSLRISYTVDNETKMTTFGKTVIISSLKPREINAILLEMDKATLYTQIIRDNDDALTDRALSVFSIAQISSLLNLAIDNKATRCTAILLNYKSAHFSEFADVSEFSLEW